MAIGAELRQAVETWMADDPDERDRDELRGLLDLAETGDGGQGGAGTGGQGGAGTSNGTSTGAVAGEAEGAQAVAGGGRGAGGVDEADSADVGASVAGAEAELRDRFAGRLTFGTAGLRGAVGAGPNRMNRAVVRAATAAVAGWLLNTAGGSDPQSGTAPRGVGPTVVLGCDARHRSDEFADEAARVLAGAGIGVHLLPRPRPTPLLAFAVRHLRASAGIMITASHNPAADNGYKLYLGDGAQVIPPVDGDVEGRIARLGPLSGIPLAGLDDPLVTRHGDDIAGAYLDAIAGPPAATATKTVTAAEGTRATKAVAAIKAVAAAEAAEAGSDAGSASPAAMSPGAGLSVVYTPMHGVAGELMLRAIRRAGFAPPHVVAAQAKPDPDFPTVAFPNPEEPGALDLALADARARGADLVLASDPDGDRLAVAIPGPAAGTAEGEWRQLTGDQLGALLGAHLLGRGSSATEDRLVATTIVSSTMLSKIAASAGARYAETLTGFKWIARAGDARPGTFVFGYEEALGYEVGQAVRDKDGIGAALALLRVTAAAKANGRSLNDVLDDLERAHGVHLTEQLSLRIPDPAGVMRRLRATPPATLGGWPVEKSTDYTDPGTGLPPSDVLSYALRQARAVIRPSGTEPKIKAYLEVVEPAGVDLTAARARAALRMAPLRASVTALLTP